MSTDHPEPRPDSTATTTDLCYSEDVEESATPDRAYETFVVRNRRICNTCFRRIKAVEPPPDEEYWSHHAIRTSNNASTWTLEQITTDKTLGARRDGDYAAVGDQTGDFGELVRESRRQVVCRHCGAIDGEGETAARTKAELIDATDRICERLNEQGISLDRDAALDTARDAKSTPGLENKDFECFRRAVAAGVRAGSDTTSTS